MTLLETAEEAVACASIAEAGAVLSAKAEAARAKPKEADINARMKITLSLAPPLGDRRLGAD